MTTFTHAMSVNWNWHLTLSEDSSSAENVERALARLDGDKRWGFSLWALPADNPEAGMRKAAAKAFLQSAGSAEAMSIEMMVREPSDDGEYALYAIGKPVDDEPGDTTISWQDKTIKVKTNEAFDADEATKIYQHYRQHNDVPDTCTRRFLSAYPGVSR